MSKVFKDEEDGKFCSSVFIDKDSGQFYFWNMDGEYRHGPYGSFEEANEELESYSEWLNYQDEEKEKWAKSKA